MSGIIKGVGKIFKKVAKVVMKVAPYALAAAAVVFTGGAALGVLPTFSAAMGSVVGGLGLSGAVGGALTGALTSAGFGAAIGGVLGGKKGLKSGFVGGLLTGGALGALSPATFGMGASGGALAPGGSLSNTINGLTDPVTGLASSGAGGVTSGALAPGSALSNTINALPGTAASTAITTAPAATAAAAPAAAGGGLLSLQNPQLLSSVFGGLAQSFTPSAAEESYKYGSREEQDRAARAFGGQLSGKGGLVVPGVYSGRDDPFGLSASVYTPAPSIQPSQYYIPSNRWEYDPVTNKLVERQAG